jgi:NAD(P)H-hydrate repair Nnr-like enzyme with NAD(P)H-hydrate epimerase domain
MDWANTNKAPVLSLDMPSGVNGSTGKYHILLKIDILMFILNLKYSLF